MLTKLFDKKPIQNMTGLFTVVLAVIALVGYLVFARNSGNCNVMLVLFPLGVMIASRLAALFVESDILVLVGNVGISVAFCAFLTDSVQIMVGYFTKVAIFGDVTQFGTVVFLAVSMLLCTMVSIVYSFMK